MKSSNSCVYLAGKLGCGLVPSRGDHRPCPRAPVALLLAAAAGTSLLCRLTCLYDLCRLKLLFFFLSFFFFGQVFSQMRAITGSSFGWKRPARTPWGSGPRLDGFGMLMDPSPGQASVT